jgi:hypothetical protein
MAMARFPVSTCGVVGTRSIMGSAFSWWLIHLTILCGIAEGRMEIETFTLSLDVVIPATDSIGFNLTTGLGNAEVVHLRNYTESFLEQWYSEQFSIEVKDVFLFPALVVTSPPDLNSNDSDNTDRWLNARALQVPGGDASQSLDVSYFGYVTSPSVLIRSNLPDTADMRLATETAFKDGTTYITGLVRSAPNESKLKYVNSVYYLPGNERSLNQNSTSISPSAGPNSTSVSMSPSAVPNFASMSPSAAPTLRVVIPPVAATKLPPGAITGIVIGGGLGALGLIGGIIYILCSRRKGEDNGTAKSQMQPSLDQERDTVRREIAAEAPRENPAPPSAPPQDQVEEEEEGLAIPPTGIAATSPGSNARKVSSRRHMSPKAKSTKFKASLKNLEKDKSRRAASEPPKSYSKRNTKAKGSVEKQKTSDNHENAQGTRDYNSSAASFVGASGASEDSSIAPPSVGSDDDAFQHLADLGEQANGQVGDSGSDLDSASITEFSGLDEENFNSVLQFDSTTNPMFQIPASVSQDQDDKVLNWPDEKSGDFSLNYSFGVDEEVSDSSPQNPIQRQVTGGTTLTDVDYATSLDLGDENYSLGTGSKSSMQRLEAKYESLVSSVNKLNIDDLLPQEDINPLNDEEEGLPGNYNAALLEKEDLLIDAQTKATSVAENESPIEES